MIKRIFIRSLIISIAGIFIFSACTSIMLYNIDKKQHTNTLLVYLRSISTFADLSDDYQNSVNQIADLYGNELRITIIDLNGNVLADSQVDAGTMENHKNREEVIDAIATGEGSSVRYSATTHQNVLYAALRIDRLNLIIRGMYPIKGLLTSFLSLLPYVLLSALIALIISAVLARRLAKDTLSPLLDINESILKMSREDFSMKVAYSKYDELNSLISSVNIMSQQISASMASQNNEKEKLNFILDNISQGVILIDRFYGIIHCNQSVFHIFNINKPAQTLFQLTRNNSIINAIENALRYKSSKFDITIKETKEIYSVTVLPLNAKNYEHTVLILLTNVTQARNNEKDRKEFFSNASHELRTPVTSIMGFSELIKTENNVQSIKDYAAVINKESKKLTDILDAILTISALEEHTAKKTNETIKINEILADIAKEIEPLCAKKNIALHIDCDESILLQMSKNDFISAINNIVDNAIKYGKENGNIWIDVEKNNKNVIIKIKDDGMGIPKIDLPRIFERFYRTEKSRETKIKGSGIGLAIVKHIVMKYGAEINVDSIEGAGTIFTMNFDNS